MTSYTTYRGTARGRTQARDIYSLPHREAEDDGKILLSANHAEMKCGDCGRGTLMWAEAGYVPWHRICGHCGSHWELHPVQYFINERTEKLLTETGTGVLHAPDPAEPVSQEEGAPPHSVLLGLIMAPDVLARARAEANGGTPCIEAGWARRARLYCRT
jgi:hypothetical protein